MSTFNPQEERELARDFVLHYLKDDGVFVTRLLSVNSSDLVVTEIINQLWLRFKQANRLYSASQTEHPNINDNTSTQGINVNYQNGITTNNNQRHRLSRIPPPLPIIPTFLNRTINQQPKTDKSEISSKDTDV
jgi:hypothetical protein